MTRLLLLEDETRIAAFVARGLKAEGYQVTWVERGADAIEAGLADSFDVIVLDVMLPDVSGMDVCEQLRSAGVSTPILMLTARDADEDVVEGLNRGADDYLAKPFAFDVLLARLTALMRRGGAPIENGATQILKADRLSLDRGRREARVSGKDIALTRLEFDILWLLVSESSRVHSRERILSFAWGTDADPMTNVVDVYVRRLRSKLDRPGAPKIVTVRGIGYRLEVTSDAVDQSARS